jgi:hypothetical protein
VVVRTYCQSAVLAMLGNVSALVSAWWKVDKREPHLTVRVGQGRCEHGDSNAQLHFVCFGKLVEVKGALRGRRATTSQDYLNHESHHALPLTLPTAIIYRVQSLALGTLPEQYHILPGAAHDTVVMPGRQCRRGG